MRKLLLSIGFLLGCGAAYIGATEVNLSQYVVNVDTNGVVAIAANEARKGILIINGDSTYEVYLTTAPATKDTYEAIGAIPLAAEYGSYEDNYYVYKSTWYAVTSTGTAKVYISEKN